MKPQHSSFALLTYNCNVRKLCLLSGDQELLFKYVEHMSFPVYMSVKLNGSENIHRLAYHLLSTYIFEKSVVQPPLCDLVFLSSQQTQIHEKWTNSDRRAECISEGLQETIQPGSTGSPQIIQGWMRRCIHTLVSHRVHNLAALFRWMLKPPQLA